MAVLKAEHNASVKQAVPPTPIKQNDNRPQPHHVRTYISNHYFLKPAYQGQDVEWGYAFDVHLNAFFPSLIILHVFQMFFYHVLISQDWFFSRLFGNLLWVVAIGYYVYITFLGYTCLPILQRTQVLLYPMVPVLLIFIVSLATGWNVTQTVMDFYHYRVV
ncbi:Protein unc-50 [Homalodisca vitripennis]|nr:Protein unc-50 [Homalodisca vitripennis]